MPWTGALFIRENEDYSGAAVWQSDADAAILIEAVRHDFHDQDLAQGINACLNKNGANAPTSNINWGGFKITNAGAGASATDMAIYGQTVTAAALDPGTNILTLTRVTGGDVTVDLSALAVGGSTSDFARYSNAANPFQGSATFAGNVTATGKLNIIDEAVGTYDWTFEALTPTVMTLRTSFGGAQFNFEYNVSAPNLSILRVGGAEVWTTDTLPSSTFANILRSNVAATITATWAFTSPVLTVSPTVVHAGIGGTYQWTNTIPSATQMQWSSSNGTTFVHFKAEPTFGTAVQIGNKDAWHTGSLQSGLTAAPTGGNNGDLAVVQSGADRGLWTRIAGTWTKLIAFP